MLIYEAVTGYRKLEGYHLWLKMFVSNNGKAAYHFYTGQQVEQPTISKLYPYYFTKHKDNPIVEYLNVFICMRRARRFYNDCKKKGYLQCY